MYMKLVQHAAAHVHEDLLLGTMTVQKDYNCMAAQLIYLAVRLCCKTSSVTTIYFTLAGGWGSQSPRDSFISVPSISTDTESSQAPRSLALVPCK